jgi:hypothetical protein
LFLATSLATRGFLLGVDILDVDEAMHIVGSWQLLRGRHLYVGFVDNKPPLLYAYYAFAQLTTGQANVAVQIPVSFANEVLRRLTWTRPLTVPVDREEVDIQNVTLVGQGAGELARLTLTGNATPRSVRETMRWTLVLAGEPLRVLSVQAAAQLEDCSGLGTMAAIGCNVRNGARAAAAETFAAALTQKYQGQFVHDLASPQSLRFNVAGQPIDLRGDLVKILFSARGLAAAAHLEAPSRP